MTDHINTYCGTLINRGIIENTKEEVARARKTFGDRLQISMWMELGEGHHDLSQARELTSGDGIDFVIGSLHKPRNSPDYYEIDYSRKGLDLNELFRVYYDEMIEMASAGCYDVIGHLNLPLRYMNEYTRARVDLSSYLGCTRRVLREAARAGKGIEINTSSLWRGIGYTLPTAEIVKMFREEGGEIVTIGSDAHRLEHVGSALDGGIKCLASAGFDKFAFYKNRVPHFHNI